MIADAYFVLNLGDKRAHFFLEVDRATEANKRWGDEGASVSGLHRKQPLQRALWHAQFAGVDRDHWPQMTGQFKAHHGEGGRWPDVLVHDPGAGWGREGVVSGEDLVDRRPGGNQRLDLEGF